MKAYYSDHFVLPLPQGHRFPMAKYSLLRDRVARELPLVSQLEAPRASDGELALAHTPAYIDAITSGSVGPAAMREIGFPWSKAMVERSRRSAGPPWPPPAWRWGGLAANMAAHPPCQCRQGWRFCVFNDAAVATRVAQMEWSRRHRGPCVWP